MVLSCHWHCWLLLLLLLLLVACLCCCVTSFALVLPEKWTWGILDHFAQKWDQNSLGYFWFCVHRRNITQIDLTHSFVTSFAPKNKNTRRRTGAALTVTWLIVVVHARGGPRLRPGPRRFCTRVQNSWTTVFSMVVIAFNLHTKWSYWRLRMQLSTKRLALHVVSTHWPWTLTFKPSGPQWLN